MKKLFLFFIITLTVVTAKAQYLSIGNLKYYITDRVPVRALIPPRLTSPAR